MALRTALANAIATHARTKELLDVKGASVEQYEQEETTIAQLKAQKQGVESGIAMLRSNIQELLQNEKEIDTRLSYTQIAAPIDGTLCAGWCRQEIWRCRASRSLKSPRPMDFISTSACRLRFPAGSILLNGKLFPLTPKNQAGASGLREYRAPLPLGTSLVEGEFLNVSLVLYSGEGVLLPNDVLSDHGGAEQRAGLRKRQSEQNPGDCSAPGERGGHGAARPGRADAASGQAGHPAAGIHGSAGPDSCST